MRGIEHQIDFIPGASIPNRPAYRANPEKTKEIQRQVDELEEKERGLKRGLRAGIILTAIGVLLIALSAFLSARSYQGLINTTPGTAKAEEAYIEAIDLRPSKPDAYEKLLNEYTGDGILTQAELEKFTSAYEAGRDSLSRDEEAYSNVNYSVGESILTYYQGESDNSARAKILQAEPFFSEVTEGENKGLADNYVFMADFYKDYRTGYPIIRPQAGYGEDDFVRNRQKYYDKLRDIQREIASLEDWLDSVDDPELRDILRLQYINGLTQEQIAAELGYARETVSRKLKNFWEKNESRH